MKRSRYVAIGCTFTFVHMEVFIVNDAVNDAPRRIHVIGGYCVAYSSACCTVLWYT
jgi:hypothetical protein